MTFVTFEATLSAIGLVVGDMENELDCCVGGNISAKSWGLHAPALWLLLLPRKSNLLPDLSASAEASLVSPYPYAGFVLLSLSVEGLLSTRPTRSSFQRQT